jgi:hypothetical protein
LDICGEKYDRKPGTDPHQILAPGISRQSTCKQPRPLQFVLAQPALSRPFAQADDVTIAQLTNCCDFMFVFCSPMI